MSSLRHCLILLYIRFIHIKKLVNPQNAHVVVRFICKCILMYSLKKANNMISIILPISSVIFIQIEKWTFLWKWHFWQQCYLCNIKKSKSVKRNTVFNCMKFSKLKCFILQIERAPIRFRSEIFVIMFWNYFIIPLYFATIFQTYFPILLRFLPVLGLVHPISLLMQKRKYIYRKNIICSFYKTTSHKLAIIQHECSFIDVFFLLMKI